MADIIGTQLPDILSGTDGDDRIFGLGGDDTLLGSAGNDILNGGNRRFSTDEENDIADYSQLRGPITLLPTGVVNKGRLGTDQLINIETIVAPVNRSGAFNEASLIDASSASGPTSIVVNLQRQTLKIRDIPGLLRRNLKFTVQNFQNVTGTDRGDILIGDARDNLFTGLDGNDQINGGAGIDTANYRDEEAPIVLLPTGVVEGKSSGTDQLTQIERIIAPTAGQSLIDASAADVPTTLNVNLANLSLIVENVSVLNSLEFTVENFSDVTGTNGADSITGNNNSNILNGLDGNDILSGLGGDDRLEGGRGNDVLSGGSGQDELLGTNRQARGRFEFDILVGGQGRDRFILGDESGVYYKDDLIIEDPIPPFPLPQVETVEDSLLVGSPLPRLASARINDFGGGDVLTLGAGETYRIVSDRQGFDIFAVTSGQSDLIADVRTQFDFLLPRGTFSLQAGESLGSFLTA